VPAGTYQPAPADLLDMGISNPAACPKCVAYLVQDHILQSLLGLYDQTMLAPGPGPMPTQVIVIYQPPTDKVGQGEMQQTL
jgi:hypothetical protein